MWPSSPSTARSPSSAISFARIRSIHAWRKGAKEKKKKPPQAKHRKDALVSCCGVNITDRPSPARRRQSRRFPQSYRTVPYTAFSGTPPCTHPRRAVQALDPKSRQTDPANFNTALSLIRHDERELFALYCCMSARTFGAGVARSWLAPPSASSLSQQKAMDSALIPCGRQRHQKSGGTIKQADPCCGSNRLTLNLGSVS